MPGTCSGLPFTEVNGKTPPSTGLMSRFRSMKRSRKIEGGLSTSKVNDYGSRSSEAFRLLSAHQDHSISGRRTHDTRCSNGFGMLTAGKWEVFDFQLSLRGSADQRSRPRLPRPLCEERPRGSQSPSRPRRVPRTCRVATTDAVCESTPTHMAPGQRP